MNPISRSDQDNVAWLTLSKAPANALDTQFLRSLHEHIDAVSADAEIRAVVLVGTGHVFSAGLDLKAVPGYSRDQQRALLDILNRAFYSMYCLPKPTIATINGHAIGGGLIMALACDYRIAQRASMKLSLAEVHAGIPFPQAALQIAIQQLPPPLMRQLVLLGHTIDASTAELHGIVDESVEPSQLRERAQERARQFAALPGRAFATIKRQVRDAAWASRTRDWVDSDPLRTAWISTEAQQAARRLLGSGDGGDRD